MLLFENFLRNTHSTNVQEWFEDLKNLISELEMLDDPAPEDIQLAYHLNSIIENFELMNSNLIERRREKSEGIDNLYEDRSIGSSVLFR